MAVLAGFQLTTPPNQPQAIGAPIPVYGKVSAYQLPQQVLTINQLFRAPDQGVGFAY